MKGKSILRHLVLLIVGPAVIAGVAAWVYLHGGRYVSTDNAYVKQDIIAVSSEISGRVVEVVPKDNQRITKGQVLFRIDNEPYRIALTKAQANLASVGGTIESEKAKYRNVQLDIQKAETDAEFRRKEMERIRQLLTTRSIPVAQFDQAEYAWKSTQNELNARRQELEAARAALIDPQLPTEQHPRYLQALAELEKIQLDISHLEIRAPADGIAANVSVHEGEYVMAGAQLFSIVDDSSLWLEANFKETDLTWVRPGQEVTVTIDAYPGEEWLARVDGITPATGAEFSLLPAQNSSGNWIKVVQRIKVNITLDDYNGELPLSAGMSAVVNIDTERKRSLPWIAAN
ncbi:MAG: HlyD family secretion protein [Gammaproteobacteria bacterium]|nr:HlyD family secretion protein [Gammaproteobacteria bacterium]MDP2141240.1 HlyD family secretion protein [Gammaproteobacteria bacterium]MDP2349086.1 HlyD family secretion protein [Gammaproteobacteria bacterium]